MPLISDPAAEENLAVLRGYVEKCGGEGSAITGWTTELYSRSIGNSAGTTDRYFFDTTGKKFRSRAEIVRALGLSGAPAIRVKGDGSTSTGVLRPGEQPATFKFEWGEQAPPPVPAQSPAEMFDGRSHGQGPLERTFENAARVFKIAGDFREFDGKDAMGAEVSQMYRRQPKRWRDVTENAYVWPAKRDPQPPSCEWSKCNCTYANGGCGADCVNRELYVECPLDCCGGGALDPACASKEAAPAPEKLDATGTDAPFAVGAFINVKADTSPGNNREGGAGTIMALNEDGTFDIKAAIGRNLWQNVKREDISREQTSRRSRRSDQPKEASSRRNGGDGRLPCANTVIQRRAYPPVEVFDTGTMGFGLRGRVTIARGQKIGEYRGEVVDQNELLERRCNRKAEDPFYIAALGDGLSIDAGHRGAYARFANHSCGPNCKLEKWRVGEEPRLVLIALKDVPPGKELTYDYNAGGTEADTTVGQECMCGAPNCLGAIGSKKNVVKGRSYASDSEDEEVKGRAARAQKRGGEPKVPKEEKPAKGRAEPVWTLEDVMALEESVEVFGREDWDLILEKTFPGSRRTPAQLEKKHKELHAHKKPAPKEKRPKKKQKLQKDGPESTAWAAQTHLTLLGSEGGAPELAEALYSAATRNQERRAGGELHCYCRLPEFPEAPCVSTDGDAAELLFCDACAGWVHPRCIRLESMPGDDEDYACPLCAYSRGDGAPLATVAKSDGKTLWTRALCDSASLKTCEECLKLWDDLEIDDGLVYAGLAKGFLETLVSEAKDFDARAAPFLATKAALSPGELRGLAELVCEGQTLELVDAATLDALRDALRSAALTAGEVSPVNA